VLIGAGHVSTHPDLPEGRVLEIPVSLAAHDAVLRDVAQRIQRRESGGHIAITNTESMYHALRLPAHMRYIQTAQHSLCDGVGVIAAGWCWGLRIARYNGPILMLDCSRDGVSPGWRHFYFGGKEGVADLMVEQLQEKFPGLQSVGTYCPPFRALTAEEDAALVKRINDARPDFVWVGLGLLKQEQWIADHLGRINVPWMVGVGAAFDYHSGAIPWAPAPLRALGLEWLFRLILQPRLRAKRYWWSLIFTLQAAIKGLGKLEFLRKRESSR
jgi:N-acetylglucosaminyldiphosphoundecaprenol N-acetyl-beta-D-mannosaminyltransferase